MKTVSTVLKTIFTIVAVVFGLGTNLLGAAAVLNAQDNLSLPAWILIGLSVVGFVAALIFVWADKPLIALIASAVPCIDIIYMGNLLLSNEVRRTVVWRNHFLALAAPLCALILLLMKISDNRKNRKVVFAKTLRQKRLNEEGEAPSILDDPEQQHK